VHFESLLSFCVPTKCTYTVHDITVTLLLNVSTRQCHLSRSTMFSNEVRTGSRTTVVVWVHAATAQNFASNYISYIFSMFYILNVLLSRYSDWLWAGRSGIESWWGRDFSPVQTGPGAHPASCTMGNGSFPGVKCGRGLLLTTHPLLVPRSCKSRAIPLPTLWATPGL